MKEKQEQKSLAKQLKKEQKLKRKDEKYFEKYGIHKADLKKKEKQKLTYTWKILKSLNTNKKGVALIIGILLVILCIQSLTPIFLSNLVDNVIAADYQGAMKFAALYCIFIINGPLWMLYGNISQSVFLNVQHELRLRLIKSAEASKVGQYDKLESGKLLSRISSDPNNFVTQIFNILEYSQQLLIQIARLSIFFFFSWQVGLFVVLSGLGVWIINRIYTKKVIVPADTLDSAVNDNYSSQATEMVRGIRDIKSLNIFAHFFNKFERLSKNKRNSGKNVGVKNWIAGELIGYSGLVDVLYLVMLLFSIHLVSIGDISTGQFSAMMIYAWDALFVFPRVSQISRFFFRMEVNAKRMFELIDDEQNPKETFGNVTLQNAKGTIEFRDVDFSYDNETIFEKLNLKIKAGECVGFVGRSGEGKSTILNLIPRMYDVNGGQILIDGVDNRDLTKDSLRETISVVPQSPYIFNMSIRENLKLVDPTATDEQIEDACRRAAIMDFIESKPEGFDTMVGEGGVVLSGGQKQRLAIARAFLKKSKILLLDEATSALDNESQAEIKKTIHNMQSTCTIVIVAHRLSTVQDCDRIFVLDGHKIVGVGKHETLKKTCKAYRDLYKQEDQ